MSEPTINPVTPPATRDVSPDDLMSDFRGKSMGRIVLVTVTVHVLVIGIFSIGYIREWIAGPNAALTPEQRMTKAIDDSTLELRRIADRYEISFADLKRQLEAGSQPQKPAPATRPSEQPTDAPARENPEKPKSEIEKTLDTKEKGPAVPDLSKDDIFSPEKP